MRKANLRFKICQDSLVKQEDYAKIAITVMFENYKATKRDFEAIEEGIRTVWRKEMDFVFKEKSYIKNVIPLTFDSRFFYIYASFRIFGLKSITRHFDGYQVYKTPHKLKLTEYDQMGWCANAEKWREYLPKPLTESKKAILISGGLLTPFTRIHTKFIKRGYFNAYASYESYLATIVHEFAHIYYNSHPLSASNQKANSQYLKTALNLLGGKKIKKFPDIKIYRSFAFEVWTELFAFCTEYYAASLFWPTFKKDLDNYWKANFTKLIQNSSFLTSREPHRLAAAIGKILLSSYPKDWPRKIFNF